MASLLCQPQRSSTCPSKLLDQYSREFQKSNLIPDFDLASKLTNPESANYLENECSKAYNLLPNHLGPQKADDLSNVPVLRSGFIKATQAASNLRSYKLWQRSQREKNKKITFHRTAESFKALAFPSPPEAIAGQEAPESCAVGNETIITIRMYRPARAIKIGQKLEKPVFAFEYHCLGSNLLTEFRDIINCVCNKKHFYDISEDLSQSVPEKTTDPGFFFITDTFYDDTRNPENAIYSKHVMKWAQSARGLESRTFKCARMENTTFNDLTFHLGHALVYLHHGNCEHKFVFSQVELLSAASACLFKAQYPYLRSHNLYNNRSCQLCSGRLYNYIVTECPILFTDPCYLCSECVRCYLYVDGEKVANFKAFRIHDHGSFAEPENVNENGENGNGDNVQTVLKPKPTQKRQREPENPSPLGASEQLDSILEIMNEWSQEDVEDNSKEQKDEPSVSVHTSNEFEINLSVDEENVKQEIVD